MKKVFLCGWIFFACVLGICAEDVDIGEIEVVEEIDEPFEKEEQPEKFTTVLITDEEDEFKSVAEVLTECPEVFVKDTGGEAGISTVSIRGSSSKNVLILLDGTPLNTGGNSSIDIGMIPAGSVERIEIIRGGDAALYGSGAMGGVINIVTKKTEKPFYKYALGATPLRGLDMNFSTGGKGDAYTLFFCCLYKYDRGDYLYEDNNGTEFNTQDDTIQKREHNEARKFSFLLNNRILLPRDMYLDINLHYNNKANGIAGPLTFENHFTQARLDKSLFTSGLHYSLGNLLETLTADFQLDYKYDGYTYANPNEYGGSSLYSSRALHYLRHTSRASLFVIPANILHLAGEFAFETMRDAGPRVEISGVVRDEFFGCEGALGILPSLRLQYNSDLEKRLHFLWNLGLYIIPASGFKIKTNTFHAFRNPDFTEMYYTYGQYVGNPDLRPEISYGGDLGFDLLRGNFFLETVLFATYYRNLIQYLLSYGFVYKPMNIDAALSYGGEFRGSYTFPGSVELQLSYTLNFLNNLADLAEGTRRQLPGQPVHSAAGSVTCHRDWVELGGMVTYEDRINITHNGLKFIEPKFLLDFFVKMKPPVPEKSLKPLFYVNANNILNIYTTDVRNYPLAGFHLDMGVSFEF